MFVIINLTVKIVEEHDTQNPENMILMSTIKSHALVHACPPI